MSNPDGRGWGLVCGRGCPTGSCVPSGGAAQIGAGHGYLKIMCTQVATEAMGVDENTWKVNSGKPNLLGISKKRKGHCEGDGEGAVGGERKTRRASYQRGQGEYGP